MFDELMESRPHRQRSTRQVVVSIAVHTVIIAVSIQLTRAVAETVRSAPHNVEAYLLPAPRPELPHASTLSAPAPLAAPVAPVPVAVPLTIPASIPPVDLARGFDPSRFSRDGDAHAPFVGTPGDDTIPRKPAATAQEVDDPVEYLSGQQPVYPPALRRVGVEGSVYLRYVVGVDGRVESESIKVTKSTNRLFEAPAIVAINEARFKAATIRGRKVRQLVEQVVRFTLH